MTATQEEEVKVEGTIGTLLRVGVIAAAIVVAFGAIRFLWNHGTTIADYHVFRSEPDELRSVPGIIHSALSLHSTGIIQLGLVLLIATPIVRVAFSLFVFAREKDWFYVGTTAIVFALLMFSLFAGFRG